ncbi:MAG: transporter [Candidatus Delongbacteria bacterium]
MKYFALLQLNFVLFSFSGVIAKFASRHSFLSAELLLLFSIEVAVLIIYAYFWQKLIKHFDISVAYANRGIVIILNLIWAYLIFNERITVTNILGCCVIISGIYFLHKDKKTAV